MGFTFVIFPVGASAGTVVFFFSGLRAIGERVSSGGTRPSYLRWFRKQKSWA